MSDKVRRREKKSKKTEEVKTYPIAPDERQPTLLEEELGIQSEEDEGKPTWEVGPAIQGEPETISVYETKLTQEEAASIHETSPIVIPSFQEGGPSRQTGELDPNAKWQVDPVTKPPVSVVDDKDAQTKIPDVQNVGVPDLMRVLSKAWSEKQGWMKSTKVHEIEGLGVLVQFTTRYTNPDGSFAIAETSTFIPGAFLRGDVLSKI